MAPPVALRDCSALALLVALALALRLIGLGHELPQHSDEDPIIVTQAESLRSMWAGEPPERALDPHYPLLLASVLALWPEPAVDLQRERLDPLAWHLERASAGHRRARFLVALIATLAVPITWLLARRFVREPWALFAAASVALSLLHLQLSQAARPHGALATWIALGLWLDLRLLERGRWRDHLAAALVAALAVSTLHTGASAVLPLVAAQALRLRRDGAGALPRVLASLALLLSISWVAYGWPLGGNSATDLAQPSGVVRLSGHIFPASSFDGGGFALALPLLWETDPLLLALALAGLGLWVAGQALRRRRPGPAAWILAAWAVPFLVVLGAYGRLPSRFLLPLVPLLAVAAAIALAKFAEHPRRRRPAFGIAVAVLVLPAWAGARLAWLRTLPEPAVTAAEWIARNADRQKDLLYLDASANPPLFMREEGGGELFAADFFPWDHYQQLSLSPQYREQQGWRTRRLIARDPATGRLRQDRESLLALLREPPAAPVGRRFAVIAFDDTTIGRDRAVDAVLEAGGRVRFVEPVLAGDLGDPQRGPLLARPRHTLATLLSTRRLGFSTVVYELPAGVDDGLDD